MHECMYSIITLFKNFSLCTIMFYDRGFLPLFPSSFANSFFFPPLLSFMRLSHHRVICANMPLMIYNRAKERLVHPLRDPFRHLFHDLLVVHSILLILSPFFPLLPTLTFHSISLPLPSASVAHLPSHLDRIKPSLDPLKRTEGDQWTTMALVSGLRSWHQLFQFSHPSIRTRSHSHRHHHLHPSLRHYRYHHRLSLKATSSSALFIHLSTYLFVYSFIQSISPPVRPSIYPSINPSIHLPKIVG